MSLASGGESCQRKKEVSPPIGQHPVSVWTPETWEGPEHRLVFFVPSRAIQFVFPGHCSCTAQIDGSELGDVRELGTDDRRPAWLFSTQKGISPSLSLSTRRCMHLLYVLCCLCSACMVYRLTTRTKVPWRGEVVTVFFLLRQVRRNCSAASSASDFLLGQDTSNM